MEFDATPVKVSVVPCNVAPRAFMTINEGTTSFFAELGTPMVFKVVAGCELCANAVADAPPITAIPTTTCAAYLPIMISPLRSVEANHPLPDETVSARLHRKLTALFISRS
jgi:hypothetical protein